MRQDSMLVLAMLLLTVLAPRPATASECDECWWRVCLDDDRTTVAFSGTVEKVEPDEFGSQPMVTIAVAHAVGPGAPEEGARIELALWGVPWLVPGARALVFQAPGEGGRLETHRLMPLDQEDLASCRNEIPDNVLVGAAVRADCYEVLREHENTCDGGCSAAAGSSGFGILALAALLALRRRPE